MKKIISCILVLMLFITICITGTNATTFEEELTEKFYNYCVDYCVNHFGDNASDFECYDNTNITVCEYTKADNIVFFSAVCWWIPRESMPIIKQYGNWQIYSGSICCPSELALYVMIGDRIYTIEEAWEQGLVTDLTPVEGFSKCTIVTRINESENTEPTSETINTEPSSETQVTEPTTEPSAATEPTEASTFAPAAKISKTKARVKAGGTVNLKVTKGTVKTWGTSKKTVAVVSNGKVTGLKKGSATITATLTTGEKLTCKVTVTTSPKLSKNSVLVKKGKTVSVKLLGKASIIKNIYTNTKYAKITSKNTATTIKVKGLKKGKTTLKVKVNGVVLKLKAKVK